MTKVLGRLEIIRLFKSRRVTMLVITSLRWNTLGSSPVVNVNSRIWRVHWTDELLVGWNINVSHNTSILNTQFCSLFMHIIFHIFLPAISKLKMVHYHQLILVYQMNNIKICYHLFVNYSRVVQLALSKV